MGEPKPKGLTRRQMIGLGAGSAATLGLLAAGARTGSPRPSDQSPTRPANPAAAPTDTRPPVNTVIAKNVTVIAPEGVKVVVHDVEKEQEEQIKDEVKRLVGIYYQDEKTYPLENSVYKGAKLIPALSPAIKLPADIGRVNSNEAFADIYFVPQNDPVRTITYQAHDKTQTPGTASVVTSIRPLIRFSPDWLSCATDLGKSVAMIKEATEIPLLSVFIGSNFDDYKRLGTITKSDPSITDDEAAATLMYARFKTEPEFKKLLDLAGYLAVLPSVDDYLRDHNDMPGLKDDLGKSNFLKVLDYVKKHGIPYRFNNSDEFYKAAVSGESRWRKEVVDNPDVLRNLGFTIDAEGNFS